MNPMKAILLTLTIVVMLIGSMSMFTVKQTEKALKLMFGRVVTSYDQPGLYFKYPVAHQIRKFDARIQSLDATPEKFLTAEKKNLIVDSFIKWRIDDVVTYFKAVGGNSQRAGQRLAETIAAGLRSEFGKRSIQEVVSGSRAEVMGLITQKAKEGAQPLGIEIIDVRIKRIELPKEVSNSVYRRMEAERERTAKELRSRGEAAAVRIQAEADRERTELLAKAERDAEQIRGEGDARAADIYAQAFSKNAEFYGLYRTLNAYKKAFGGNDVLLLQPNSEFFKYFKQFGKEQTTEETTEETP